MEAKYVACSLTTHEVMQLRSFLQDLNLTPRVDDPIEMFCDKISTVQFTKDPKFHKKTKHVKRCYHFVQGAIKTKQVTIKYIPTNKMIVDLLTKSISWILFKLIY